MSNKQNANISCVRGNPPPVPTPTTWAAVFWEIAKLPNLLVIGGVVLLLTYVSCRILGVDLLDPMLKQFGHSPAVVTAPIDISGEFDYRCSSSKDNTVWGGSLRLSLKSAANGAVIYVSGERKWKAKKDKAGGIQKKVLDPPIPWNSIMGYFVSDQKIQWLYETHPDGVSVKGSSQLDLVISNGQVNQMSGSFADLAPGVQFGTLELHRVGSFSDSRW